MVPKSKNPFSKFAGLVLLIPLCLLLLLGGCGERTYIDATLQTINASEPLTSPAAQTVTPIPNTKSSIAPTKAPGNTPLPQSGAKPQNQGYLEGTFNCFAQGSSTGSGYINALTFLFRPDGTWADITYGQKYAANPKYNFTYQLKNSDLTLIYPSGNSNYKVGTENGAYKLVQYGEKNNQTCYQKV